jgi:hypothetical protein
VELRRLVGLGGPQREVRNENLRIDQPYRNGAHSRRSGCHEQRLQEGAARLVRSDGHRTAPHKNWVALSFGNQGGAAHLRNRTPSLISIKFLARRSGLELCCRGAAGYGPYASFFVWFLFWYGCGAHRRCGVADRLTQHFNIGNGRHYPRPATARTVTVELQRHSPVAKGASPAKDFSPVVSTAKADTKQIKHYKPKLLARQRNNYGYGNARGYASGYGPSSLFFR